MLVIGMLGWLLLAAGAYAQQSPQRVRIHTKDIGTVSLRADVVDSTSFECVEGDVSVALDVTGLEDKLYRSRVGAVLRTHMSEACAYYRVLVYDSSQDDYWTDSRCLQLYGGPGMAMYDSDMDGTVVWFDGVAEYGHTYRVVAVAYDRYGTPCSVARASFDTPVRVDDPLVGRWLLSINDGAGIAESDSVLVVREDGAGDFLGEWTYGGIPLTLRISKDMNPDSYVVDTDSPIAEGLAVSGVGEYCSLFLQKIVQDEDGNIYLDSGPIKIVLDEGGNSFRFDGGFVAAIFDEVGIDTGFFLFQVGDCTAVRSSSATIPAVSPQQVEGARVPLEGHPLRLKSATDR